MRTTSLLSSQSAFESITARQERQTQLQQQLGTGLRASRPGDDPVGVAQAEMARSRLAHLAQDQRATDLATTVLDAADSALSQGVNLLQSAREALVAAGDGAYGASERKALAQTLRGTRDQLLALANARDSAGGYVFAGQGSDVAPLAASAVGTNPAWTGPGGTQSIGEQGLYQASVDGQAVFMAVPQGNGVFVTAAAAGNTGAGWIDPGSVGDATQLTGHRYQIDIGGSPGSLTWTVQDLDAGTTLVNAQPVPAGGNLTVAGQDLHVGGTPAPGDRFSVAPAGRQSLFQTLDEAIAALEQPSSNAGYAQQLGRAQADLDQALDGMTFARAQVGRAQRGVDDSASANQQQTVATTARRSDLQDLDYASALSEMQSNQTALEAALKAYASIGKTSLMQLLS